MTSRHFLLWQRGIVAKMRVWIHSSTFSASHISQLVMSNVPVPLHSRQDHFLQRMDEYLRPWHSGRSRWRSNHNCCCLKKNTRCSDKHTISILVALVIMKFVIRTHNTKRGSSLFVSSSCLLVWNEPRAHNLFPASYPTTHHTKATRLTTWWHRWTSHPQSEDFGCTAVLWSTNVSVESQSVFVSVPPHVIRRHNSKAKISIVEIQYATNSRRSGIMILPKRSRFKWAMVFRWTS